MQRKFQLDNANYVVSVKSQKKFTIKAERGTEFCDRAPSCLWPICDRLLDTSIEIHVLGKILYKIPEV